jgi:hypothetical protein
MRYLDVSPMISGLRFQPADFEYAQGWLQHVPSRHRFRFDRQGRVTIDALCGCAAMSIKPEQADELVSMFKIWRQHYWEDEPRVRHALQEAQCMGATDARHTGGLPPLPSPRRPSRRSGRGLVGVGDPGGMTFAIFD